MTLGEFQAWLDGYCEGKDMPLTGEQFSRIRKKLRTEVDASKTMIDLNSIGSTIAGPPTYHPFSD